MRPQIKDIKMVVSFDLNMNFFKKINKQIKVTFNHTGMMEILCKGKENTVPAEQMRWKDN